MAGVQLRTCFELLTNYQKHDIKELCEKYRVKPECSYPGGEIENMSFDFGDCEQNMNEFIGKMELIMDVSVDKVRRRVFGHRIECPLTSV